jgi:hypothetical protein
LLEEESVQTRVQSSLIQDTGEFKIHSRTIGQPDSWNLNAYGKLILDSVPKLNKILLGELGVESEPLSIDDFYAGLNARGLSYGPCFRSVTELKRVNKTTVVANLEKQAIADDFENEFILHPTLLDGAFQSLIALVESPNESSRPYVPISISRIHVTGKAPHSLVAICETTSVSDVEIVGDITLCDESGNVVVKLDGVCCQTLSTAESVDALAGVFHELKWIQDSTPTPIETRDQSWLLVGPREETNAVKSHQKIWQSNPLCLTDLESLDEACGLIQTTEKLTDIVFLSAFEVNEINSLDGQYVLGFFANLTNFVKALVKRFPTDPINIHVVTRSAIAIETGDENSNVIGARMNTQISIADSPMFQTLKPFQSMLMKFCLLRMRLANERFAVAIGIGKHLS